MATGIQQSGLRTGASPMGAKPAGPGGPMGQVMGFWGKMSPKMRVGAIIVLIVLIAGGAGFYIHSTQNAYVELYKFALSESDQKEIANHLTQMNVDFDVKSNRIWVHPSQRQKLASHMLQYGLPHRQVGGEKKDQGGMIPPSDKEKEFMRLQDLQADLIEQIRLLPFVADAYVQIVPEDENANLLGNPKPATAQVMLQLKPGQHPTREQVAGIVTIISMSVRGMTPENVKVIDDSGKVLNNQPIFTGGTTPGGTDAPAMSADLELKRAMEEQLKASLIPNLNQMLGGPNNYTFNVNTELDFRQQKVVTTDLENPTALEDKNKIETYTNIPRNNKDKNKNTTGPKEVALTPGMSTDPAQKTYYNKGDKVIKYTYDKIEKTVVMPAGSILRMTASLSVNKELTEKAKADLQAYLENALGINQGRGDSVVVMGMAYNTVPNSEVNNMIQGMHEYRNRTPVGSGVMTNQVIVGVMAGSLLLLLTLVAVFLMKQHRVQVDKTSLLLSNAGASGGTSDISDLLSDKSGKSSANTQTTQVNNRAELEKLAKDKPTKVAELLRSTWLAEKER